MCYAVGSLQQATSTCPMCKVFKPSASRCPHIKEVCRNTAAHPRHDVIYLKNAEVQTFNGCGFCKWAKTNPPPTRAGYQNPGWPGCCRPPLPAEHKYIGAADWHAVNAVHHTPIPPEIRSILDGVRAGTQSAAPGIARRSSYNVASPSRTETGTIRSSAVAIPAKVRSGGSPQQVPASLSSASRGGGGDGLSSSLPNASSMDQHLGSRRSAMDVFADKRPDPSNTSQNSPGRKNAELSASVARRSTDRRPSISSISSNSPPAANKPGTDTTPPRRRTLPAVAAAAPSTPPAASSRRTEPSVERAPEAAPLRRGSTIEETADKVEKMAISSASSSSSSGSSETTIISDGGFTDYLSDESEAELQRQAEAKAAQVAQNQMEEREFRAARQQLAHVDLRPPKSWRGEVQAMPRSQIQPSRNTPAYGQPSFTAGAPAYAASTHSRG